LVGFCFRRVCSLRFFYLKTGDLKALDKLASRKRIITRKMAEINYYKVDNLEYMRSLPDNFYDLVFADPEQGKKEHGGKNRSGFVKQTNGSKKFVKDGGYSKKEWDNNPPSSEYFDELFRISRFQVIWGIQYFEKNFGQGRIIWDKVNGNSDQYDCEIAYTNLTERTVLWRYMWSGMMQGKGIYEGHIQQGNKKLNEKRIHPTHKPSKLYAWTLKHFNIPIDWKIFDPNLGSGSVGIACYELGYSLDACEKEDEYYNGAKVWLNQIKERHERQPQIIYS
jgi:site-specific DNA-methyltransferase (adenine-specific)